MHLALQAKGHLRTVTLASPGDGGHMRVPLRAGRYTVRSVTMLTNEERHRWLTHIQCPCSPMRRAQIITTLGPNALCALLWLQLSPARLARSHMHRSAGPPSPLVQRRSLTGRGPHAAASDCGPPRTALPVSVEHAAPGPPVRTWQRPPQYNRAVRIQMLHRHPPPSPPSCNGGHSQSVARTPPPLVAVPSTQPAPPKQEPREEQP